MRLLVDEMYPESFATALRAAGIDAVGVASLQLRGAPDTEVFTTAQAQRRAVITENVADFTQIAAWWVATGAHHAGLLIALSSRFSRRPHGIPRLVGAVVSLGDEPMDDRVVFLHQDDE